MKRGILNAVSFDEKTGLATFSARFGDVFREQARIFFNTYEVDAFIPVIGSRPGPLKNKSERKCRFCGKSNPEVFFKKKAHLIPEFLGNKMLLSDFECDSCNYEFGLLENEFANFLGAKRTLSMQRGKNGIPTFKSDDGRIVIRESEKERLSFSNEVFEKQSQSKNERILRFKYSTHPYTSLLVYKCLVKIGVSLLKENDAWSLAETIRFLLDKTMKTYDNTLFSIHQYFIPGPHTNFPLLFAFKKRPEVSNELVPFRTFVIYFHTLMTQFFIPFDPQDDKANMPEARVQAAILPPLVEQAWIEEFGMPQSMFINLDSTERTRASEELTLKFEAKKKENE